MAKDIFFVAFTLIIFMGIVLAFGFNLTGYLIASANYDVEGFAKCLTDKEAIVYTSRACTYCSEQKELFGEAFKYVSNVDCLSDPNVCSEKGIRVFPTWIIKDVRYEGVQSLERLNEITGCQLK